MKKLNLGPIDKLHKHLSGKSAGYTSWHLKKAHHFVHWGIFTLLALTVVLASFNAKTNYVSAGGGDVFLINASTNKGTAVADGTDGVTLTVFTYWNVCDTLLSGGGKTGTGDPSIDPGALCQSVVGSSAYHPEGETNRIAISVSGSGNSYDSSNVFSDSGGNVTFKIKSTVAETKTITILNGWRDLTNEWGSKGIKTVTFTAPASASPTNSSPTSSSGTSPQKKTATSPAAPPTQPGAPAVPVLESLMVGNTQFAADKIQGHQFKQNEKKIFSGKTIPNGVVHLYFQSDPFEGTATADKDGNWTYELVKDIGEGNHELQVAVTDPTTNLTSEKSAPVKFSLIKEANAATPSTQTKAQATGYIWYVLGGIILIVIILGAVESYLYFGKGKGFVLRRILKSKNQIVS
ncbi:MAG: Ig-like domain-containing protein [Patescibacteria group bacterium]